MVKSVNSYQVFLSSRFAEFEALRKAIIHRRDVMLSTHVEFIDLDDGLARPAPPAVESIERIESADIVILILGDTYGEPPDGYDKSFVHMEFDAAKGKRILAFRASSSPTELLEDPRLLQLISDVKRHCTDSEIDATDVYGSADEILKALRTELVKLEELAQQSPSDPLAAALGREILSTASNEWRNGQIGPLDRHVLGEPTARTKTVDSVNLVGRADDEWNEACAAYRLRSVDLTAQHLQRAIELRPLDGEARYWLSRLKLAVSESRADSEIAEHAAVAAAAFAKDGQPAKAGLANLVEAKAYRNAGDLESGLLAARNSVRLLGDRYFEPNLELAYLATASGLPLEAFDATRDAFTISPPSLRGARLEFRMIEGGMDLLEDSRKRLGEEIDGHLATMRAYAEALYEHASNVADVTGFRRLHLDRLLEAAEPRPAKRWPLRRRSSDDGQRGGDEPGTEAADRGFGAEPTKPGEYESRRRSGEPEALVRDAVSRAAENLDRLRDVERLLQRSASAVRDARRLQHAGLQRLNGGQRRFKQVCLATFAAIYVVMGLRPSVGALGLALYLVIGGLVIAIAATRLVGLWREHHERRGSADRLVSTVEEAWVVEATAFDEFVTRYERDHLMWRTYGPPSKLPDYVDTDSNARLRVRRVPGSRLRGDVTTGAALAPDFRQLLRSIPSVRPGHVSAASDLMVEVRRRSTQAGEVGPSFQLLGFVDRRTDPPTGLSAGRWLAYRHPGTGPTNIAGPAIVEDAWLGGLQPPA